MFGHPVVAVLIPSAWRSRLLSAEAEADLAAVADVRSVTAPVIEADDLPELLLGAAACLTGWGTPPLTEDLVRAYPSLGLVAHTAGSIHHLVPAVALERGLRVSHAASFIAGAVAELVISQALLGLRRLHEIDRAMKQGEAWRQLHERSHRRLLGSQTVGVVGAGYIGRQVIRLLLAFGSRVLVYDPTLAQAEADHLGVALASLDDLFAQSMVVTLHAPVLPETRGMIGAAQLTRLPDGAVFINTARDALLDHDALLRELQSGRIVAALDVFDPEPLPPEHPFRALPNAILSPHIAGHSEDSHRRQGQAMVDEVGRFLRGEPLHYEIDPAHLSTMA